MRAALVVVASLTVSMLAGCGPQTTGTQLLVLANGSNPTRIVADGQRVYWVDSGNGTVMSAARNLQPVTLASISDSSPSALTLDNSNVYWASDQGMYRVPQAGGTYTQMASWQNGQPGDLRAASGSLYWTDSSLQALYRLNEDGSGSTESVAPGQLPLGVTVSNANVYWTDMSAAKVSAVSFAGGPAWTVYQGRSGQSAGPCYVAVDAENLYWTDDQLGTVNSMPLTGGQPQVLASNQQDPLGITVDDQYVYWADPDAGAVFKVQKIAAGDVVTVAQDDGGPYAVAVDSTYIYWTNDNGQVLSAMK